LVNLFELYVDARTCQRKIVKRNAEKHTFGDFGVSHHKINTND